METYIQAILCGGNQEDKNRNNNLEIKIKREGTNNTSELPRRKSKSQTNNNSERQPNNNSESNNQRLLFRRKKKI